MDRITTTMTSCSLSPWRLLHAELGDRAYQQIHATGWRQCFPSLTGAFQCFDDPEQ